MTVATEEELLAQQTKAEDAIMRILGRTGGPMRLDELLVLGGDELGDLSSVAIRRAIWSLANDNRLTFTDDFRVQQAA